MGVYWVILGLENLANAAKVAFLNIQKAFQGEAERLGLRNEQDIVDMVDEIRKEMWEERYAGKD